jgi:bifunctional non-homologous end joining protein LigD
LLLKSLLDDLQLRSFAKTSGSRGLHVFVPIRVEPTADVVLHFAGTVVAKLAEKYPKQLTVEHSIAARGNRVYLDAFRNGAVQTVVSPYSVRRKAKAPISTPLDWSEVKATLDPASFNLGNFTERMKRRDPWKEFFSSRQSLRGAIERLQRV